MKDQDTILVADDNHESLKLLAAILSAAGYQVRPADSGDLALASATSQPPDLIMLDIRMPDPDGIEVFRRLQANPKTADVPVILMSAVAEVPERVEGLELGAIDYIAKPFEPRELLARVANRLEMVCLRRQVQQSQERLIRVQKLAHIGNWEWNIQTGALYWEQENYRIFELPPETVPSVEAFLGSVHPDDLEMVKQSMSDALERQKPYDLDMRIRCPDGTEKVVQAYGEVDRDAGGKPIRFFGTVQDITERRRAEDEIRSLAKFPGENASPVLRVAGDGCVLYANEAAKHLLSAWRCRVGGEVPTEWRERIERALHAGVSEVAENELGERVFSLTLAPVVDMGYVNIYGSDITERKRLQGLTAQISEAEREKLRRDLHDTVCQRLAGAGFLADHLREDLAEYPGGVAERADEICRLVRQALDEAHLAGGEVASLPDAPDALVKALLDLAHRIASLYNVSCRVMSRN